MRNKSAVNEPQHSEQLIYRQQKENIWMCRTKATELRGSWLLWPGSGTNLFLVP